MLRLFVSGPELYDEEKEEFISTEGFFLELEHSLVSLSKWESIFEKPFLAEGTRTTEELVWYVKAMIVTKDYPDDVVFRLNQDNYSDINAYIDSAQSATTFGMMPEMKHRARGETITSELIYYWMVTFNIPFECETWHLNRLFSLIRICNVKNNKGKRMSKSEIAARNRALNEERRARLQTRG
jgi:hypothetical protein